MRLFCEVRLGSLVPEKAAEVIDGVSRSEVFESGASQPTKTSLFEFETLDDDIIQEKFLDCRVFDE